MAPMLELVDVHTYYGESHVLHGVSLAVAEGTVTALLGRVGMGKTTTLHTIIGLVPPRSGTLRFMDQSISGLPPHRVAQMGLALVPQGRRIFPSLSVKENLTMAARGGGKNGGWSLERVYSLFPVLGKRARFRGNRLSGGEQQMLAIGRALMTNPKVILMDEPSEGLAPLMVQELGGVIEQLVKEGVSILLVEQNLDLALRVASYAYILNKGMVVHHGTANELEGDRDMQCKYLGVSR